MITGDAVQVARFNLPEIDYVFTSPSYWDMLHARGAQTQPERRASSELDVVYSEDPADLGNIGDYEELLDRLVAAYAGLRLYLRPRSLLQYFPWLERVADKTMFGSDWPGLGVKDIGNNIEQFLSLDLPNEVKKKDPKRQCDPHFQSSKQ